MNGAIVAEGVALCGVDAIFDAPEGEELFREYAAECANPLLGAIDARRGFYADLEALGALLCFGAREGGGLRGFAVLMMSPLPHYGRKFATVESLFVTAAARNTRLGHELMRTVDSCAAEAGCEAIFYSAPLNSRLAQLLSLWSGRYTHTNEVFCRRLK